MKNDIKDYITWVGSLRFDGEAAGGACGVSLLHRPFFIADAVCLHEHCSTFILALRSHRSVDGHGTGG